MSIILKPFDSVPRIARPIVRGTPLWKPRKKAHPLIDGRLNRERVIGSRLSSDYVQTALSSHQAPTWHETRRLCSRHRIAFPEMFVRLFGDNFFGSRIRNTSLLSLFGKELFGSRTRKHIDYLGAIGWCSPNRSSDCSGNISMEAAEDRTR